MEWYEQDVCTIEQRLRVNPPTVGPAVFYGSSSMRMWEGLENDFRYVGALNLAFGGSTLAACVWFFERLVVPCNPRSIICYAGDNDLGDGRTPEDVLESFRELLVKVESYFPAIPFTMLSIKPSPSRWHLADRIRYTNEEMNRILLTREKGHFVDVYSAMLGTDGRPDESLFLEDGLHVSPKGYVVWKNKLLGCSRDIF